MYGHVSFSTFQHSNPIILKFSCILLNSFYVI
jgi:hypothetical protein